MSPDGATSFVARDRPFDALLTDSTFNNECTSLSPPLHIFTASLALFIIHRFSLYLKVSILVFWSGHESSFGFLACFDRFSYLSWIPSYESPNFVSGEIRKNGEFSKLFHFFQSSPSWAAAWLEKKPLGIFGTLDNAFWYLDLGLMCTGTFGGGALEMNGNSCSVLFRMLVTLASLSTNYIESLPWVKVHLVTGKFWTCPIQHLRSSSWIN